MILNQFFVKILKHYNQTWWDIEFRLCNIAGNLLQEASAILQYIATLQDRQKASAILQIFEKNFGSKIIAKILPGKLVR